MLGVIQILRYIRCKSLDAKEPSTFIDIFCGWVKTLEIEVLGRGWCEHQQALHPKSVNPPT